jgi:hypothetical protein
MTDIIPVNQTEFEFYNDDVLTTVSFRTNAQKQTLLNIKTIKESDDIILNQLELDIDKTTLNRFGVWLIKNCEFLKDDGESFKGLVHNKDKTESYDFDKNNILIPWVDPDDLLTDDELRLKYNFFESKR